MTNMRYIGIIFFVIALSCTSKDNSKEKQINESGIDPTADEDEVVFNGPCVYRKIDFSNIFPTTGVDQVDLVAYCCRSDSYSNRDLINNGRFAVDDIEQRITLNKVQKDSLYSILYNFKPSPVGFDTLHADCYNPRHSIVFYEKNNAKAYLEVCFECGGTKQSANVDFGLFCPEKMCMLQKFFKANKVDFGIIDELCE
jgi:hypothetical protein